MSGRKRKKNWKFIGVCVFFAVIAFGAVAGIYLQEMQKKEPDMITLTQNIWLSILCSLVASFLFVFVSEFVNDKKEPEELYDFLLTMQSQIMEDRKLVEMGVVSIREKVYYDKDDSFWNSLIDETGERLELAGHSISRWFEDKYRDTFTRKICAMARDGKKVRIIITGEPYKLETMKELEKNEDEAEYRSKEVRTQYWLYKMMKTLDPSSRKNVQLYIAPRENVTYLYIGTDLKCLVSPYIVSSEVKNKSFLLELKAESEFSVTYHQAFQDLVRTMKNVEWGI